MDCWGNTCMRFIYSAYLMWSKQAKKLCTMVTSQKKEISRGAKKENIALFSLSQRRHESLLDTQRNNLQDSHFSANSHPGIFTAVVMTCLFFRVSAINHIKERRFLREKNFAPQAWSCCSPRWLMSALCGVVGFLHHNKWNAATRTLFFF